jgi:hypothetical protein
LGFARQKWGAVAEWQNYDASGIPSHIDEETYVLDTTHPAAFEYLREVFRTLRGWGATFFKTDFMDWGLRDATQFARHDVETSVQHYRRVLTMIREEIGEDSFWLACISPFAPFLGFADGMRVSNDSSHHWSRGSTLNMFEQMTNCQFFNNIWWQNDPDVVFLRDKYLQLSQSEIESMALFAGISGGVVNTSDALHEASENRLALWRFLQPDFTSQGESRNARFPFWNDKSRKLLVAVRPYSNGDCGLLAVNLRDESVTEVVSLGETTSFEAPHVFRWNQDGSESLGKKNELVLKLAPHASQLLYVSEHGSAPRARFDHRWRHNFCSIKTQKTNMKPTQLRCEYETNPLGIDVSNPRLSWKLQDTRRGAAQSAYRICVARRMRFWRAVRLIYGIAGASNPAQNTWIEYGGQPLGARQRAWWKVSVWNEAGEESEPSEAQWWETGLMGEPLGGEWIGTQFAGGSRNSSPAPYVRTDFSLGKPVQSARLYATALGVYEFSINGARVGNDVFAPGWTDYNTRVQYHVYDVTRLLQSGDNTCGAILGDGWYCGHLEWQGRERYGDRPKLRAQIVVTFEDGSTQIVATDASWKTAFGPILESDMLMGEHYDARRE